MSFSGGISKLNEFCKVQEIHFVFMHHWSHLKWRHLKFFTASDHNMCISYKFLAYGTFFFFFLNPRKCLGLFQTPRFRFPSYCFINKTSQHKNTGEVLSKNPKDRIKCKRKACCRFSHSLYIARYTCVLHAFT